MAVIFTALSPIFINLRFEPGRNFSNTLLHADQKKNGRVARNGHAEAWVNLITYFGLYPSDEDDQSVKTVLGNGIQDFQLIAEAEINWLI